MELRSAPSQGVWQPFRGTLFTPSISYLHERQHKRELRLESAHKATGIAALQKTDQERTLLFNLRNAFVQTLQAKHLQALAKKSWIISRSSTASRRIAITPATSRRSTCSASTCNACSMSPIIKPR